MDTEPKPANSDNPHPEQQPEQKQNYVLPPNPRMTHDNRENVDNSALFKDTQSAELTTLPMTLQGKLRDEYYRVLRSRDNFQTQCLILMENVANLKSTNSDLMQMQEQKNLVIKNLESQIDSFNQNRDNEDSNQVADYFKFSVERNLYFKQMKAYTDKFEKKADTEAKIQNKLDMVQLELNYKNEEIQPNDALVSKIKLLRKQDKSMQNNVQAITEECMRLEDEKDQMIKKMNLLIQQKDKQIVDLQTQIHKCENIDAQRLEIAQDAVTSHELIELKFVQLKELYCRDLKHLTESNAKLEAELSKVKSAMHEDNRKILEQQFEKLFPKLFAKLDPNTDNIEELYAVTLSQKILIEKLKKQILLSKKLNRVNSFGKIEEEVHNKVLNCENSDISLNQQVAVKGDEVEDGKIKDSEIPIRDCYERVCEKLRNFTDANQSLSVKLQKTEFELNSARNQINELMVERDNLKRKEIETTKEKVRQRTRLNQAWINLHHHSSENDSLRERLKNGNEKLKQLDSNILEWKRENSTLQEHMKQAYYESQVQRDITNEIACTNEKIEMENLTLTQQVEEQKQEFIMYQQEMALRENQLFEQFQQQQQYIQDDQYNQQLMDQSTDQSGLNTWNQVAVEYVQQPQQHNYPDADNCEVVEYYPSNYPPPES